MAAISEDTDERTNKGMNEDLLTITDLHKHFGSGARTVRANDSISMNVASGQVVGLLGHNGAGKSTLVNQVVGLLRPTSGTIRLDGFDAVARPAAARRVASVQAQANIPITGLTPQRAIELVGRVRGADRRRVRRRAEQLIDALDIGQWARTPAQKISGGIARLTAFAMCAVVPGRLVILDRGRVIARGAPDDLIAARPHPVVLELTAPPGTVLSPPPGLAVERSEGARTVVGVPAEQSTEAIAWASRLREDGVVERYSLEPVSLEDVYVDLTAHGSRG